jgi:hypothetical protein
MAQTATMSDYDRYAQWLVQNAAKKGTPEFDTVAAAYKDLESQMAPKQTAPAAPSEGMPGARQMPMWRQMAGPTVEMLGTVAGAGLGVPLGPAGVVGGAGLGYGIAREGLELLDVATGLKEPRTGAAQVTEPMRNVVEGAAFEAGGRAAAPIIAKGAELVGKGIGKVADIRQLPKIRAGKIAREAVGEDLDAARNVLAKSFSEDVTAAQALARIDPATGQPMLNMPTAQALLQRASARDPKFFTTLFGNQEAARYNALADLAGGADQTAARQAREEMKNMLNQRLIPVLEAELGAANMAGKLKPQFEQQARQFGQAAADKVEDVRRFSAAGERAANTQVFPVPGQPRAPQRYTYMGELAERAERVAADAAEGSLRFGEAARFKQAAADSLAAHGLKPLETKSIVAAIDAKLADPAIAPNRDVQRVLTRVKDDLLEWTNAGGVIDAWALDTIRKSSVNQAARDILGASADPKAVKKLAAQTLGQVRPLIVDAVEQAGGAGYGAYLKTYERGMQEIGQTKLGGEAMRLYLSSPRQFVDLVEGNSPKVVEKIFGSGSYNIFKEMSAEAQTRLGKVASEVKRGDAIAKQATEGEVALVELLKENAPTFKLPNWFSVVATTGNKMLDILENKIGKKTMDALTKASRSAKDFDELLGTLPAAERSKVLKVIQNPNTWGVDKVLPKAARGGVAAGATNALAPDRNNEVVNELIIME